ncbi:cytochrome P450 [Kitasatospora sp. NPDC057512]|uniref:cytochrome P450 family protein n=1 Tax=Kitasatospora sp. NPDC057512 TaxID=3346154 RepID=UPI00369592FC
MPNDQVAAPPAPVAAPAPAPAPGPGPAEHADGCPVREGRLPDGTMGWVVSGFAEVRDVLTDPRLTSATSAPTAEGSPDPRVASLTALGLPPETHHYFLNAIVDLDPPRHTRLRRLVSREFTARRIQLLAPSIELITDRLLDELPDHRDEFGVVDLVEHFAYPLPVAVICELVGVPEPDRYLWSDWSRYLTAGQTERVRETTPALVRHVRELIDRRRAEPGSDLISGMLQARDDSADDSADGGPADAAMSEDEMVSMTLILVLAGHETTAHLIANGTLALLTHPDQLALLRRDRALLPHAVEELLRWCGPVPSARLRYADRDLVLRGAHIRRGQAVHPHLDAANLDLRHHDHAERLDLTRTRAAQADHHLAFGYGIHFCLGAALARLEAAIAFGRLLDRYPGLSLAADADSLIPGGRPTGWELNHLPLRLGRA